MKKIAFLFVLMLPALVWGYDFSLMVPSGQTLYFNYVDGGVEVVKPSSSPVNTNAWDGFTKPVGALTIPATVTHSGSEYPVLSVAAFAFYGCSSLTSLVIEEGVSSLGNSAFSHCSGVTTVDLPATVVAIGSQTFGDCSALTGLTIHRETPPPSTANGAFYNTSIASCTLHVPCGSEEAYTEASPWSGFGNITASNCSVTILTEVNDSLRGTVTGGGSYLVGTSVVLTATPAEGFFFVCWNDGDTLNPRIFTATADCTLRAMFFGMQHDTMVVPVVVVDTVPMFDTMVVIVPEVDTVLVHDTMVVPVTVIDTVPIYDTILVPVVVVDTVLVHDTIVVPVVVVDTVPVHDTITVPVTVHDTVPVHDTMVVTVTVVDTAWRYDTVVQIQTDTVTVYPTFYRLQVLSDNGSLGLGVGSAMLPAGTEVEICALPLEGGRFLEWNDGNRDNPRRLTLMSNLTLTAQFEHLGIEEARKASWTLRIDGHEVTVTGVEGQPVRLYDVSGRQLAAVEPTADAARLVLPTAGVYVVRVGDWSAKKIVIE